MSCVREAVLHNKGGGVITKLAAIRRQIVTPTHTLFHIDENCVTSSWMFSTPFLKKTADLF